MHGTNLMDSFVKKNYLFTLAGILLLLVSEAALFFLLAQKTFLFFIFILFVVVISGALNFKFLLVFIAIRFALPVYQFSFLEVQYQHDLGKTLYELRKLSGEMESGDPCDSEKYAQLRNKYLGTDVYDYLNEKKEFFKHKSSAPCYLYSVGLDGVDNGGKITAISKANLFYERNPVWSSVIGARFIYNRFGLEKKFYGDIGVVSDGR